MREISDYHADTPNSELYEFLSEAIIHQYITDFSSLLTFCRNIPINSKTRPVFEALFVLIRKLYWGFFRDVDKIVYPKVWKEIVLTNDNFPHCGDLKKNLTISNIFVGILDLHGYTSFCDKHKNNLSMLKALDELIQLELMKLARARDVVLQRQRGDEIVLVGTSAWDIVELTLDIINVFARKKNGNGTHTMVLPDMHVSAGIAGGNKFTPFIITLDGDLSGGVVNTAARLQSRANELSENRSRILVRRTTYHSYVSETKHMQKADMRAPPIHFIDSGTIRFKGLDVAVCELLFDERDNYRVMVEKDLQTLMKSIEHRSWKEGVFENLLLLLIRLYKFMPPFKIETNTKGIISRLQNEDLINTAKKILRYFKEDQNYLDAFYELEYLINHSKSIRGFDPLILEYAEQILERYRDIIADFDVRLESRTKELSDSALSGKARQMYKESQTALFLQERLKLEIRKYMSDHEIAKMWRAAVNVNYDTPDFTIRSGKQ